MRWAHIERRGAAPLSRRTAAAGWEVPPVYPGDGGAPRAECAGEMHGTQTEHLHAEKAEEVQKQPAYKRPDAYIWHTW
jgi:hypothetical protein